MHLSIYLPVKAQFCIDCYYKGIYPIRVISFFDESKSNSKILINTIEWLSKYSSEIISRNISLLKEINKLPFNPEGKSSIFIPVIQEVDREANKKYTINPIEKDSDTFILDSENKFAYDIYNSLKRDDEEVIIIDSNIGNLGSFFNLIKIELNECVDYESLNLNSKLWDEAYYKKWEHFLEYPIYIYEGGEIPFLTKFRDIKINEFSRDLKVESNGKFFVSKKIKNNLLENLPESFPKDALDKLRNWHYMTLRNESLLDEDSFVYNENIDRLLQDRLGISKDDQKKENGNAKTHALYFLDKEGFDVSQVDNSRTHLTGIKDNNGNNIDCIVKSAIGGLLYLNKYHWDMLEVDSTYLVVIYPGKTPRLFKDRTELLSEELAENILFRIKNSSLVDEVNGVFKALESKSHLILVTNEKMKESLFSKLKQDIEFHKEDDTAVEGDDFKF